MNTHASFLYMDILIERQSDGCKDPFYRYRIMQFMNQSLTEYYTAAARNGLDSYALLGRGKSDNIRIGSTGLGNSFGM